MDLPDELKIPDEILECLMRPDMLRQHIEEGKSLQEIIGYTDALMQQLYAGAHEIFSDGRYMEAKDSFLFLTTLNPYVFAYWLGLAFSYQMIEEYEQAILAYECAIGCDETHLETYYYKACCHSYLNCDDEALKILKELSESCSDKTEYKELMQKTKQAEKVLKQRKKL